MLKWTVIARREADKPDASRRSSVKLPNSDDSKPKRRHSSGRRRSIRNSLSLEMDKENQFTSTPIKSCEDHHQFDPLRDVSNLTPKDTTSKRLSLKKSRKSASPGSHRKFKKKKSCLNPSHRTEFGFEKSWEGKTNYFKPFEAVDSHIEGVLVDLNPPQELIGTIGSKRKIQETFAPTLPTFAMEYSPCFSRNTQCRYSETPLGKILNQEERYPRKKARIEHVDDFLHQINFGTSLEESKVSIM